MIAQTRVDGKRTTVKDLYVVFSCEMFQINTRKKNWHCKSFKKDFVFLRGGKRIIKCVKCNVWMNIRAKKRKRKGAVVPRIIANKSQCPRGWKNK